MDEKKEKCKRCGIDIYPKTKRAEFCSQKCKIYWHREKKKKILKSESMPEFEAAIKTMSQESKDKVDLAIYSADIQFKISELEKELSAIPDKTKGLGKKLAESINKKIFDLKRK